MPNAKRQPTQRRRSMMKRALLVMLLLCGAALHADTPSFSTLEPKLQQVLKPYAEEWETLDPITRERLTRGAERWLELSNQERTRAADRLKWWRTLPPERQAQIRASLKSFRALPPEQQQRIRQAFQRFQNLSPERRAELIERFQRMNPSERDAFLLGAQARGNGIPWRELWGPIPRDEQRPLIAMTQSLTMAQKRKLAALVGRTPAAEREALRRRLLAMGFAERAAYLDGL
jgi:hypothetical protein